MRPQIEVNGAKAPGRRRRRKAEGACGHEAEDRETSRSSGCACAHLLSARFWLPHHLRTRSVYQKERSCARLHLTHAPTRAPGNECRVHDGEAIIPAKLGTRLRFRKRAERCGIHAIGEQKNALGSEPFLE